MKKVNSFFAITMIVLATSCAVTKPAPPPTPKLVPITEALIKEYNITPAILKKLQYYVGVNDSIVLQKGFTLKGATVGTGGKLLVKNSEITDKVIIYPGTPGVCLEVDSDVKLKVTFSDNTSFLWFGPDPSDADHAYALLSLKGTENSVKYGKYGSIYTVEAGMEINLMINLEQLREYDYLRVEPGRRVGQ